jgi:hypothetical protein
MSWKRHPHVSQGIDRRYGKCFTLIWALLYGASGANNLRMSTRQQATYALTPLLQIALRRQGGNIASQRCDVLFVQEQRVVDQFLAHWPDRLEIRAILLQVFQFLMQILGHQSMSWFRGGFDTQRRTHLELLVESVCTGILLQQLLRKHQFLQFLRCHLDRDEVDCRDRRRFP